MGKIKQPDKLPVLLVVVIWLVVVTVLIIMAGPFRQ